MNEKIRKAIAKIGLEFEALSIYPMSWDIHETCDVPTMGTDFKSLYYSPTYIETLSLEETVAVVLHEVFHCVLLHPAAVDQGIGKNKNEFVWMLALEQVTNAEVLSVIVGTGYKLPGKAIDPVNIVRGSVFEETGFVYSPNLAGKNEIEVYECLMQYYKAGSEKSIQQQQLILTNDVKAKKQMNAEEKQAAIEKTIATIKKILKQRGKVSANLERLFKDLTTPKVPWQRIVRQFVSQVVDGYEEFSFTKPNIRRQTVKDIIIPATQKYEIDEPVVVFDTSGSIGESDIKKFASELQRLLTDITESVIVITTDTEVKEHVKISSIGDITRKLKFIGGGGTDFRHVFEKIKNCEFMIFFTDGYASYPTKAPKYPVLWVLTKDHQKPPFGKVAYVYNE